MVGVGDDQFSFPVVSNPPVCHLMQSSPLWRISSRVYHHDEAEEKASEKEEGRIELEGSAMEKEASSSQRRVKEIDFVEEEEEEEEEKEVVEEENIDMLWEDFFFKEVKLGVGKEATEELEEEDEEGEAKRSSQKHLCLPGGGRMSGGGLVAMVAIVKLLKKMFLIRNNSAHNQVEVDNKR